MKIDNMNENESLLDNDKKKNKYLKHAKWALFYKKILIEIICIILLILTFVFRKRLYFFSRIFASILFKISISGIIIYYIALIFLLVVNTIELIINIKGKNKNEYSLSLKLEKIFDIPLFICKCVTGFIFIMIYVTSPCTVSGSSMNDTFNDGDRVLCYNLFTNVKRNDVVVLDATPYVHNGNDSESSFYIKRVIAKGGDTIKYDRDTYRFYVNGELLMEVNSDKPQLFSPSYYSGQGDPYLNLFKNKDLEVIPYEYTLESDELLLMGDNRYVSSDSRSFGMVKLEDIYGIVYLRIYPLNKIRFF